MTTLRGSENGNRFSPTGREMRTASGLLIDVTDPRPEQMLMADIAVGLAHKERFGGHNPLRPTVAQHSLAVEHIAAELYRRATTTERVPQSLRRAALMHDADEAHLVDIIGAVKKVIRPAGGAGESAYDVLASRFAAVITERFDCAADGWKEIVHEADRLACAFEMMGWGESDTAVPPWLLTMGLERFYPARGNGRLQLIERAAALGMVDA